MWTERPEAAAVWSDDPTERSNGTTLSELIRRVGALDLARALHLAIEMGQILEAAHNAGVIHGTLRPDDVLIVGVGDDERVRILGPTVTSSAGDAVPSSADEAPLRAFTETADILAFGVILYRMLGGGGPDDLASRKAGASRRKAPPPLRKRRREVAPALERLVMQMLAPAPWRRPRAVGEVVNRLWIERERLRGAGRHRGATGPADPWSRQTQRLVGVAASLLVVVGGGLIAVAPVRTPREARVAPAPPLEFLESPRVAAGPANAPAMSGPPVEDPGLMAETPLASRGESGVDSPAESTSAAAAVPSAAARRSVSPASGPETATARARVAPEPSFSAPPSPERGVVPVTPPAAPPMAVASAGPSDPRTEAAARPAGPAPAAPPTSPVGPPPPSTPTASPASPVGSTPPSTPAVPPASRVDPSPPSTPTVSPASRVDPSPPSTPTVPPASPVGPTPPSTPALAGRGGPPPPPISPGAEPPTQIRQALAPTAAGAEAMPAPAPAVEAGASLPSSTSPAFRGAPPPGAEAGPSVIADGYGARGAGGMFEGRLRLSSRGALGQAVGRIDRGGSLASHPGQPSR